MPSFCILILILLTACNTSSSKQHPSVNADCDNPDADVSCCFVNMPSSLQPAMIINSSAGEKMVLKGTIFHADGKTPYEGVVLYAYHTDANGLYSKKGNETGFQKWHGALHGWCKTGKDGKYEIHTIRPAPYPGNTIPAHIHAAVKTPGEMFWISDFVFTDDALITEKYFSSVRKMEGGTGAVEIKTSGHTWVGERDIILTK
jgi:protocatechuate 3,4-dioxygenase, beta subunit